MILPEFLQFAFMQRALVGGVLVALVLGWIGVYATSRNMSFVGEGVAHASLAAIAFALLVGWSPMPAAIIFGVLLACILYVLDTKTSISRDTAIGVIFSSGMALGVLLLQFNEGYVPELMSFLFGSILSITNADLVVVSLAASSMIGILFFLRKQLLFLTVDPEGAYLSGMNKQSIELLLYILTAVSVVVSSKLVGIVLVSGLLVLPSAIAKAYAKSFSQFLFMAIIASVTFVVTGLIVSFYADWPSGASIVLVGTMLFLVSRVISFGIKKFSR
jgi:ABC-type Mn2+/Zn2+ transport system permease subunit